MFSAASANPPPWSRWIWPICVFLVLSAASFVVWRIQREILTAERQSQFEHDAALVTVELRERLNLHAQFLRTLAAYFATRRQVSAEEWKSFSERIRLEDNLPGAHLFGFAPAVSARDLKAFETTVRRDFKHEGFRVFPEPGREIALPVVYLAPQGDAANRAMGFDIYSEEIRRRAIDQAREKDDIVISASIVLVFDRDAPSPGFLMIHPIYRPGMPIKTVTQRRAAFAGVVYAAYRTSELMRFLDWTVDSRNSLQVVDSDSWDGEPAIIYYDSRSRSSAGPVERSSQHELTFGHRTWRLLFEQHGSASQAASFHAPFQILVAGLTISALFGLLFFVVSTHRQRAEDYARRVSANLRQAEASARATDRQKQAVLDAATEIAIIATDTRGVITLFNRGAEKMLGYRAADLVGRYTPEIFHLGPEVQARAQVLSVELGRPVAGFQAFVAISQELGSEQREWTYVRADSQPIQVDLVVTTQRGEDGTVSGYLGVAVDITERKLAEGELERHRNHLQDLVRERTADLEAALKETRASHQAKSEFLANMSHELRTPMHAILGFSGLGIERSREPGQEKLHQYFERIRQSADRLLDLINDLLDLAKLEAGRMGKAFIEVDILHLIQDTASQLESLLLERRLKVEVESGLAAATVLGDARQLERVIYNLLSNAIKFSPAGGTIELVLDAGELPGDGPGAFVPAVVLTVSDSGVGIPEEELESIFEKFVQSSKTKSGAGGTGLGLAICREIVRTHHGTIAAKNNAEGGASFQVKLPSRNPLENRADRSADPHSLLPVS